MYTPRGPLDGLLHFLAVVGLFAIFAMGFLLATLLHGGFWDVWVYAESIFCPTVFPGMGRVLDWLPVAIRAADKESPITWPVRLCWSCKALTTTNGADHW